MATDCRVCNRPKATKFNHFGATSIYFSCRAFFMRAAQSDLYKTFYHSFDCKIDAENRKSCKKCRFEKCCTVGMNERGIYGQMTLFNRFNERVFFFGRVVAILVCVSGHISTQSLFIAYKSCGKLFS